MKKIEVRHLAATDVRSDFLSGNASLDEFFRKFAGQNQFKHRIGTTYVALCEGRIVGYFTVSAATVEPTHISGHVKGLPQYQVPVLRLARMAVAESLQRGGVGKLMLRHVFQLALQMANDFGCVGVLVDAKPQAVVFYSKFGFVDCGWGGCVGAADDRLSVMFLKIKDIEKASVRP
ncbi:GNAT family N-acetyltransferase [Sorangium cellulosum]|uniref:GNAT family N-acetyltransferase n=1 Tax=Sorangium cellulosum TaxID=56 RepID=UPI003D9A6074